MRSSICVLSFTLIAAAVWPGWARAETEALPPLPRPVASLGAAVSDGWLYVYGGHCGKTHNYDTDTVIGTFQRLKLADGKTWEALPGGPAVQGLALVAHGGKIYRLGGMQPKNQPGTPTDNYSLSSCARFDPATKKWEALPDLPAGRSSHDAVVCQDKIYVVGGWHMQGKGQRSQWHTTALVLDLTQQPLRWEIIEQPFARRALTAAVHDGKVWVFGGMGDGARVHLTVNVYDPARRTWTTGPDIPGQRHNGFTPASCVLNGALYVSPADGVIYRLSQNGTAWVEAGQLKQRRLVHRLVAGDNVLLAVGGAFQGTNVGRLESVQPSAASAAAPVSTRAAAPRSE